MALREPRIVLTERLNLPVCVRVERLPPEHNGDTWYDVYPFARRPRAFQQAAAQSRIGG